MYECVVEGSVNVSDTEDILAVSNLRAESHGCLFLWGLGLLWWLEETNNSEQTTVHHGLWAARMSEAKRTI